MAGLPRGLPLRTGGGAAHSGRPAGLSPLPLLTNSLALLVTGVQLPPPCSARICLPVCLQAVLYSWSHLSLLCTVQGEGPASPPLLPLCTRGGPLLVRFPSAAEGQQLLPPSGCSMAAWEYD